MTAVGLARRARSVLGVLDDGVEGGALRGRRGGQVVVAFDLGAVVGVDSGPAAASPGALVPHRLVGGADPVPVQREHLPFLAGHVVAGQPPSCRVAVDRSRGDVGPAGLRDVQPELVPVRGRDEVPQQPGVVQPLLEQPDRPPGQDQALGRGPVLDVGQQDRRVAGPVDVARGQVVDAVGDDARADAEREHVGDRDVQVREQLRRCPQQAGPAGCGGRGPGMRCDARGRHRAVAGQQPSQVVQGAAARGGILAAGGPGQGAPVCPVRRRGHFRAGLRQPGPVRFRIGRKRAPERLKVVCAALGQLPDPGIQRAPVCGKAPEHPPGACLPGSRSSHPELSHLSPPQVSGTAREPPFGQCRVHRAQRADVVANRACRVDRPVRVDEPGQARQQVPGEPAAGRIAERDDGPAAVAEHAGDAQRVIKHLGGHQASSSANSSPASRSASASASRPAAAPALSQESR